MANCRGETATRRPKRSFEHVIDVVLVEFGAVDRGKSRQFGGLWLSTTVRRSRRDRERQQNTETADREQHASWKCSVCRTCGRPARVYAGELCQDEPGQECEGFARQALVGVRARQA